MKHLKVLVKWNWWWNFACVSTKSLNFEIYFLSFPWEIIFRYYFGQLFMYLALKKYKNDCKILKITLVQIFVHESLKLLHLLSDFVLICVEILPLCVLPPCTQRKVNDFYRIILLKPCDDKQFKTAYSAFLLNGNVNITKTLTNRLTSRIMTFYICFTFLCHFLQNNIVKWQLLRSLENVSPHAQYFKIIFPVNSTLPYKFRFEMSPPAGFDKLNDSRVLWDSVLVVLGGFSKPRRRTSPNKMSPCFHERGLLRLLLTEVS